MDNKNTTINYSTEIGILEELLQQLQQQTTFPKKIEILNQFNNDNQSPTEFNEEEAYLYKCLKAIKQENHVFGATIDPIKDKKTLQELFENLRNIEKVYENIGGLIGYHLTFLKAVENQNHGNSKIESDTKYYHPPGYNISQRTRKVNDARRHGIEAQNQIAEMYPVGGAGDRLDLHDETTGEALPAAELMFCGYTLLEGLIRDLQAREYLYFKLYQKQLQTPIALMTSHEKNNHQHIQKICQQKNWFGRDKKLFLFFLQPLVPVIAADGMWVTTKPLTLMLKPGGHGVIWKLAKEARIFDELKKLGYRKTLLRQINNPVAGTDSSISTFLGIGSENRKAFGFASCERIVNSAEGTDILVEKKEKRHYTYTISNIEYTEFQQHGISDTPAKPGKPYSLYPANTNILFADIDEIEKAMKKCPIPGLLVNMKNKIERNGEEIAIGRLESTMQNISDYIENQYKEKVEKPTEDHFKTYITYNTRRKTISVTKKSYKEGNPILETPEGCFYEMMLNHDELLRDYCNTKTPPIRTEIEYIKNGPSHLFLYHPALGPDYTIIGQKIKNNTLHENSEMQLEIVDVLIDNIDLDGSLLVHADQPMGNSQYSNNTGKLILKNVKIRNKGIDKAAKNVYWKNQIERKERLKIVLHGNAEFYAENTKLEGNLEFEVPNGYRMVVGKGLEKLSGPSWEWQYRYSDNNEIILSS